MQVSFDKTGIDLMTWILGIVKLDMRIWYYKNISLGEYQYNRKIHHWLRKYATLRLTQDRE